MKSESALSKKLKDNWRHYFERVECKGDSGFPDVILYKNKEIHVELKFIKEIFNKRKLEIRDSQKLWFMKYPGKALLLFEMCGFFYIFEKKDIKELCNPITYERFVQLSELTTNNMKYVIRFLEKY